MADERRREKVDPTIRSAAATGYQEDRGNHPVRPLAEQTYSAENIEYTDNADKPDPTTIAQLEVGPDKP